MRKNIKKILLLPVSKQSLLLLRAGAAIISLQCFYILCQIFFCHQDLILKTLFLRFFYNKRERL